jgi:hypothetical protein
MNRTNLSSNIVKQQTTKKTFREEQLSLANQIRKKEEDILLVEKEMGELTKN